MPSHVVMRRIHRVRDARFRLEPEDERVDEIASADPVRAGVGKERRRHGRRGMAVVARRRVVVVVDVRADAVDERREQRIDALTPRDGLRIRRTGKLLERAKRDVDGRMCAAANRTSNDVDDGTQRFMTHIGRNVVESLRNQPFGESTSGSGFHGSPGILVCVSISADIARWASHVSFDDLPGDVVHASKLRVLDVIGLSLAGAETPFGRSVREATLAISPSGPCRIIGFGDPLGKELFRFRQRALADQHSRERVARL